MQMEGSPLIQRDCLQAAGVPVFQVQLSHTLLLISERSTQDVSMKLDNAEVHTETGWENCNLNSNPMTRGPEALRASATWANP